MTTPIIRCPKCPHKQFKTQRGYSMHLRHSPTCSISLYESKGITKVVCSNTSLSAKATRNIQNIDVSEEDNNFLDMSYDDASNSNNMILFQDEEVSNVEKSNVSFEDSNSNQLVGGGVLIPSNTTCSPSSLPDKSLQTQYDKFVFDGYSQMAFPSNHKTEVELLTILKDAKAPLYVYNQIMEWAHNATLSNEHIFKESPTSRKKVIDGLYTRYDMHGIKPRSIEVTLP